MEAIYFTFIIFPLPHSRDLTIITYASWLIQFSPLYMEHQYICCYIIAQGVGLGGWDRCIWVFTKTHGSTAWTTIYEKKQTRLDPPPPYAR